MAAGCGTQALSQLIDGEVALDLAADSEADGSGVFRTNDGDGVRFFGDADAGAVPGAELRGEQRIHGKGKKARGCGNAIFLDDHRTVVQGSAGAEDSGEEIVGKASIERYAAFDVGAQSDFTFDDDQGAGLVLGEKVGGQHDVVVGITFGRGRAEERQAPSEIGENVANLRLENHD